jgi:hypothetical protein
MSRFAFTFWQQAFRNTEWALRLVGERPWQTPTIDRDLARPYNLTQATAAEPFPWAPELVDVPLVVTAHGRVVENSLPGFPIQRIDPNPRYRTFTEFNFWGHANGPRRVPIPAAGDYWVRGHPARQAAWDRHWVGSDGVTSWEALGMDLAAGTLGAWCVWHDGEVLEGRPPTAANISLAAHVLDRFDPPHRICFGMSDYVGVDGKKQPGSGWPTCGDTFRLSEAAFLRELAKPSVGVDAIQYLQSLRTYGVTLRDRNGSPVPNARVDCTAGAQWNGHGLGSVTVRLSDLELATAA